MNLSDGGHLQHLDLVSWLASIGTSRPAFQTDGVWKSSPLAAKQATSASMSASCRWARGFKIGCRLPAVKSMARTRSIWPGFLVLPAFWYFRLSGKFRCSGTLKYAPQLRLYPFVRACIHERWLLVAVSLLDSSALFLETQIDRFLPKLLQSHQSTQHD